MTWFKQYFIQNYINNTKPLRRNTTSRACNGISSEDRVTLHGHCIIMFININGKMKVTMMLTKPQKHNNNKTTMAIAEKKKKKNLFVVVVDRINVGFTEVVPTEVVCCCC